MTAKTITTVMAASVLALVMCAGIAAADTGDGVLAADDEPTLYIVLPAEHRLIFPFGNPILFGVAVAENTSLIYHFGSGLTNIAVINLYEGGYIFHADAPAVTENTVYTFVVEAIHTSGDVTYSELAELTIYVGVFEITVDGEVISEGKNKGNSSNIWFWIAIILMIVLFLVVAAKVFWGRF